MYPREKIFGADALVEKIVHLKRFAIKAKVNNGLRIVAPLSSNVVPVWRHHPLTVELSRQ